MTMIAWFETLAQGSLLTMTTVGGLLEIRHPEERSLRIASRRTR